jgi:hypothetical protein
MLFTSAFRLHTSSLLFEGHDHFMLALCLAEAVGHAAKAALKEAANSSRLTNAADLILNAPVMAFQSKWEKVKGEKVDCAKKAVGLYSHPSWNLA